MADKLGLSDLVMGLDIGTSAALFTKFGRWYLDAVFFVYMRYIQVKEVLTCLS